MTRELFEPIYKAREFLAARDAEVAKAAFIAGVEARRSAIINDVQANIKAEQYANKLRQQAKGGE
jgi:hypothetical protein